MTFKQLKNELIECRNNPVKEYVVRRLMKEKYKEYLKNKARLVKPTAKPARTPPKPKAVFKEIKEIDEMDGKSLDILDDIIANHTSSEVRVNTSMVEDDPTPRTSGFNDMEIEYSDKFKNSDPSAVGGNLMLKRLDNEVNIKKSRVSKKDFIAPYADGGTDKYASFSKIIKNK